MVNDRSVKMWVAWTRSLRPIDLLGPIVDKELRVTARRPVHYAMRTLYVAALTLSLGGIWLTQVGPFPVQVQAARTAAMSAAGHMAVLSTLGIQIFALPVLAAVLLSTSISDEIQRGTLAVLMTTPLDPLRIVLGKLIGRLAPLSLLIALSLPLLAIVRIFGGVSWQLVVMGVWLTITTTALLGSLSLLVSTWLPRAHHAAFITLAVYIVLVLIAPIPRAMAFQSGGAGPGPAGRVITAIDPYAIFLQAGGPWISHGLGVLLVSGVSCLLASWRLRRVMLTEAFGGRGGLLSRWFGRQARRAYTERRNLRSVRGPCVFWKELQRLWPRPWLEPVVVGVAAVTFYGLAASIPPSLEMRVVHAALAGIIVFVGLLRTAVLAAGACSYEREKRCWPVLLTTLLDERRLVEQKALAILVPTLPLWIWLLLHTEVFVVAGVLSPLALGALLVFVPTGLFMFLGLGLYFGQRAATVTRAVVMTFAVAIGLCFVMPMAALMNPVVGTVACFMADNSGSFTLAALFMSIFGMVVFVAPVLVVDTVLGAFFLWQTGKQIRHNIFAGPRTRSAGA